MKKLFNGIHLGVQSYTFRTTKDQAALCQKVKGVGLDTVEVCGVHVAFGNPESEDSLYALIQKNGLAVSSIGINGFKNDEASAEVSFAFAKKFGVKYIGADPDLEAIPMLDRLCRKYDVKLAMHNHGRHHRYGSFEQISAFLAETPDTIGLCLDTAWALDSGLNPVYLVEKFAERIFGVHFKDFAFDDDMNPTEVIVGTGALDLAELKKALAGAPNWGYASVEYEEQPEDPTESVKACVDNILKYFA